MPRIFCYREAVFFFAAPEETGTWRDMTTTHECLSPGRARYIAALGESGFRAAANHIDTGKNNYYDVEKLDS
ncbi:MAG: hypothetical protein ACE5EH_05735 [Gammaproteobacteria bacterium]